MVTPNVFTADSSIYDFGADALQEVVPVGGHPIAAGMMPDDSKYYVANFLDSTITVIALPGGEVIKTIDLLANYNPITGEISGPIGGLPIQTPVSPDGRYMVTANTLTASITIVDRRTDELVAMLPCDAGCHGVQFGAKQGGGYYAYVANSFANSLLVVDVDPNNDGDLSDARIAGRVLLNGDSNTRIDDRIVGLRGQGGQGVPVPYNGWVQNLPDVWKSQLTPEQQNPFP
jgi:DNA-binding beta-propeller fold protein YncE